MRRLLASLMLIIGFGLPIIGFAQAAYAVDVVNPICQNPNVQALPVSQRPSVCQGNSTNTPDNPLFGPSGVLTKAVNILSLVAGVIAVFVILIAGIKLVVSAGDPNAIASARQTIIYAVISLVIVGSVQAAVFFLLSKL